MDSLEKHEVNNILLIIASSLRVMRKLVKEEPIDREKIVGILDGLEETAQRLNDMTNG